VTTPPAGLEALGALLDGYAADDGPLSRIGDRPAGVAFTGLGSSRYAALTASSEARRLGIPAWSELASSTAPTPPADSQVLVAISASGGRVRRSRQAARYRAGGGRVFAVTNEPASHSLAMPITCCRCSPEPREPGSRRARSVPRSGSARCSFAAGRTRTGQSDRYGRPVARLETVMGGAGAWLPAAVDLFKVGWRSTCSATTPIQRSCTRPP
jgi:hypothetical protein